MNNIQNKIKSFFSESKKYLRDERVIFGSISLSLLGVLIIVVLIILVLKFTRHKSAFSTIDYSI